MADRATPPSADSPDYRAGEREVRPWGSWEVLGLGTGFVVKRIMIVPGGMLSMQRHRHRAEHWIVIRGTGTARVDGVFWTVNAGSAVFIPRMAIHRLENVGDDNLVLVEVQTGDRCEERDIERL